jgi:hypothetical protein
METGIVKKSDWYEHGHAHHMETRHGCHSSPNFPGFSFFLSFFPSYSFCIFLYISANVRRVYTRNQIIRCNRAHDDHYLC